MSILTENLKLKYFAQITPYKLPYKYMCIYIYSHKFDFPSHQHTESLNWSFKSMETYVLIFFALFSLILYGVAKAFYTIWWKPKRLERKLKQQGIRGTLYKPLVGDMKELVRMITEAWSEPLSLTHQIIPRVDPFTLTNVQKYGTFNLLIITYLIIFYHAYYSCSMKLYLNFCYNTCKIIHFGEYKRAYLQLAQGTYQCVG